LFRVFVISWQILFAMRLFIAVDLDDAAREAIGAEQGRIASAMGKARGGLKWVKPDHMHLTLVFLGEVGEPQNAAVVAAMGRSIDGSPFHMALEELGVFPSHGAPRVLWIGITEGATQLAEMYQEIAARVATCGVALEARPFHPHLTLGRWRDGRSSDRRNALAAMEPGIVARVAVNGATLYHSRLSSTGSTYTALARARLSGRTTA